jgi:hypothetical protein
MSTNLSLALILVLALITLAFKPTLAQEAADEERSNVADHMHEHLTRIGTIKAEIVAGRLAGVREPAIWLADHETVAGLPVDFEPYVAQMRSYARHVIEARDLVTAAIAVSQMARACGNCHLVNGVELEFGYDRLPRQDLEDVVTHMQRHQWAADRLWEGLIGPSDNAWNRGADMLIDVPLNADDVTTATEQFDEISKMARRIHALGGIGTETVTPDARSELYGEVIGLCATCHVLLARGPAN